MVSKNINKIIFAISLLTVVSLSTIIFSQSASGSVLPLTGSISGTVFRDFNFDGTRSSTTEPGQSGVEIVANCITDTGSSAGAEDDITQDFGPVTSSADGSFTLTSIPAGKCRVEAHKNSQQTWLKDSALGAQSSSVQFVDASSSPSLSFAFSNPDQYSGASVPDGIVAGQFPIDSTAPSSPTANYRALTQFPYTLNNTAAGSVWSNSTTQGKITSASNVGSVWGVAYHRGADTLFTSALSKRYTGTGPAGPNAIYEVDRASGTTTTFSNSVDADGGQVPSNAARSIPNTLSTPYTDPAMFSLVGKTGWGDIDISDDDKFLYAVNLFDKKLYQFDVNNGSSPSDSWTIPNPSCSGGSWRPWGLGVNDGLIFAGGICDAFVSKSTSDLKAAIYSLDPSTGTWSSNMLDGNSASGGVQEFALNYPRDYTVWQSWSDDLSDSGWAEISPTIFARTQPILSDIDFDNDGSAIISFKDRTGDQLNWDNARPTNINSLLSGFTEGDILRARPTLDTLGRPATFEMENAGISSSGPALPIARAGGSTNNGDGPGNGEFYQGDTQPNFGGHPETSLGSTLFVPGRSEILFTSVDPSLFNSGGVVTLSNNDGARSNRFTLYENNGPKIGSGKSSGLGDLEALAEVAPVEIGNRVFFDADKDGIQDPGENPISGVTVELRDSSDNIIATAITDANGNYLFSGQSSADRTSTMPGDIDSFIYDVTELVPGAGDFTVSIPNAEGNNQQSVLTGYEITTANAGTDLNDSDGIKNGNISLISFTIDSSGEVQSPGDNNHSFDFGFRILTVQPTSSLSTQTTTIISPPSVKADSGTLPATGKNVLFLMAFSIGLTISGYFVFRRSRNRHTL